jgi:AraC-like DNA-binding protein
MDEIGKNMDESMIPTIPEGFQGQRLIRLPRSVLDANAAHPLLQGLRVTDAGFFPNAQWHTVQREHGVSTTLVILCTHGAGWIKLGDQERQPVSPNDLVWLPAHQPYSYGASPQQPWTIVWAHFEGAEVELWHRHLTISPGGGIRSLSETTSSLVCRSLEEAGCVIEAGYTQTDQIIAANLIRAALSHAAQPPAEADSEEAEHRVFATIRWMSDHLTLSPQLAELASLAAVSVPHYSAIFRRLTGYSPVNYHMRLRLQRACFLLDTTTGTISEIARRMGFEDAFYFSRIFRKIVGHSPRQYRALKKG